MLIINKKSFTLITRQILTLPVKYYKTKMEKAKYRFYDIAANLTDEQFSGVYHGKGNHADDRKEVIERALGVGCDHLLIAAGCVEDAQHSFNMCQMYDNCYATIGVHPCRAKEPFDKKRAQSVEDYFVKLEKLLNQIKPKLVAIGQCGLDYDRLQWSTKQQQQAVFPFHFDLAQKYNLPMYLHNRNTGNDFYDIVRKNRDRFPGGVVHSFTGTQQELNHILDLDLYVGVNGCSLKTQQNIEVLKKIPIQKLMIQTDSPYCEIKNTHASMKFVKTKFPMAKNKAKKKPEELLKGRNEPCRIVEVFEAVCAIKEVEPEELAKVVFENSVKLFKV